MRSPVVASAASRIVVAEGVLKGNGESGVSRAGPKEPRPDMQPSRHGSTDFIIAPGPGCKTGDGRGAGKGPSRAVSIAVPVPLSFKKIIMKTKISS